MITNYSLHWLTLTFPLPEHTEPAKEAEYVAERLERLHILNEARPYPHNYKRAVTTGLGVLSWHPEHHRMKLCYNLNGTACERLHGHGLSATRLITQAENLGGRCTRIDLACDIPGKIDIADVTEAVRNYPSSTRARTAIPYDIIEIGEQPVQRTTGCYIGSRKSDRFLNVYDKALEADLPDILLTRIEARNKARLAERTAEMLLEYDLPTVTRSVIRDYADLPISWWQSALSGPSTELPPIGRKVTDTDKWLSEVVAPLLKRRIDATGGMNSQLYRAFSRVIIDATEVA